MDILKETIIHGKEHWSVCPCGCGGGGMDRPAVRIRLLSFEWGINLEVAHSVSGLYGPWFGRTWMSVEDKAATRWLLMLKEA